MKESRDCWWPVAPRSTSLRRLPGLIGYVQNFRASDPLRRPPAWDVVIELRFASVEVMEAAWASETGIAATDDLRNFADLSRSSWGRVREHVIRR